MFTDIHSLADNLVVIEGRPPTLLWEACDVPSIVFYRAATTLYVLDTSVGPSSGPHSKPRSPPWARAPKRSSSSTATAILIASATTTCCSSQLSPASVTSSPGTPRRTRTFARSYLKCTPAARTTSATSKACLCLPTRSAACSTHSVRPRSLLQPSRISAQRCAIQRWLTEYAITP